MLEPLKVAKTIDALVPKIRKTYGEDEPETLFDYQEKMKDQKLQIGQVR